MNDLTQTARALLSLTSSAREKAAASVAGFNRVRAQLGDDVAAWAYADRGFEPGQRGPCGATDALTKWVPTAGDWCRLLVGVQGTGKTIAAARHVADRGGTLVTAVEADSWGFGGGEKLRRASQSEWLLVDDLGENKTRPGDGNLAALVCNRYASRSRCPTVFTSVLTLAEIERRYGSNVSDRLRPHVVELFDRERESKRGTASPRTTGIDHAIEVARAGERADWAARGILDRDESVAAVAMLASLLGVDLNGDDITKRKDQQMRAQEDAERLGHEFLTELGQKAQIYLVPDVQRGWDEAQAWLDSLGPTGGDQ